MAMKWMGWLAKIRLTVNNKMKKLKVEFHETPIYWIDPDRPYIYTVYIQIYIYIYMIMASGPCSVQLGPSNSKLIATADLRTNGVSGGQEDGTNGVIKSCY